MDASEQGATDGGSGRGVDLCATLMSRRHQEGPQGDRPDEDSGRSGGIREQVEFKELGGTQSRSLMIIPGVMLKPSSGIRNPFRSFRRRHRRRNPDPAKDRLMSRRHLPMSSRSQALYLLASNGA